MLRGSEVSAGPEIVPMDASESDSMSEVQQQEQSETEVNLALENVAVSPVESQSEERITPEQPTEEMTSAKNNEELPGKRRKFSDSRSQSLYINFGQPTRSGRSTPGEGIPSQPGSRKNSEGQPWDSTEIFVPGIQERRVTWSQSRSASLVRQHGPVSSVKGPANRPGTPHALLVRGYAEEPIAASQSVPSTYSVVTEYVSIEPEVTQSADLKVRSAQLSVRSHQSDQSEENQSRRGSLCSQSGEDDLIESRRFSRKLKSPRLRRRRQINTQTNSLHQAPRRGSVDRGQVPTGPPQNSSSNSDSDGSQRRHGKQTEGSHRVLKLGSLTKNRGMLWNAGQEDRLSPELYTFSEPELPARVPDKNPHKPSLKSHRSMSIPEAIFQEPPVRSPVKKQSRPPPDHSPPPSDFQLKDSPLESLLERAKGREREREGTKRSNWRKERPIAPPEGPSLSPLSTTPSPLPSDGDRETEGDEVDSNRLRVTGPFHGWREGNVDGSDDERKSRWA